jgi:hypothetical protein
MSRLLLLAVLAVAAGCENSKPPTQTGGKAVEVQTTAAGTVSPQ